MATEEVLEETVDSEVVVGDDDDVWSMSDEELERAFEAAKGGQEEFEEAGTEEAAVDDEIEMEQPSKTVDSDDNAIPEVETVDVEASKEETTEAAVEETKVEQVAQKRKFKANGKEFEFSDEEIFEQFGRVFGQAMNYTQKMQAIAPYRGMISALQEQGLTDSDVNLMIDVLKGDKQAIAAMLKRTGVDALELDGDSAKEYRPKSYGRNETELAIQEVVDEIARDPEYNMTAFVIEKQWDERSRRTFVDKPELIRELHIDVKNGTYDKVSPMALKMKVLDGGRKSDIEYYVEAGKQYYAEQRAEEYRRTEGAKIAAEREAKVRAELAEKEKMAKLKADEAARIEAQRAAERRKAAAPTASKAGTKTVIDYLDDSDEAYEEWYKKLQAKY